MNYFKNCCISKDMKNNFQISHNRDNYPDAVEFHSHDFYEIYFFADGNVIYYIEDESYHLKKGDVLVIPPGKLHRPVIENDIPYERYVLWLYGGYVSEKKELGSFLNRTEELAMEKHTRRVFFDGDAFGYLVRLFNRLNHAFYRNARGDDYICEGCIALIAGEIYEALAAAESFMEQKHELVTQVISYINANLACTPPLEDLAKRFFVSKYYLSHKFKEYTRTSIHKYILMKRINLAKQLLEQGKTPNEACSLCGFSTYSNFYKEFKNQTGMSPKKYTKENIII